MSALDATYITTRPSGRRGVRMSGHSIAAVIVRTVVMIALSICICAIPSKAFADLTNVSIDTTASIQTNGSIRIVEQRSIDLDEPHSAISLRFTGLPSDAELEVMSVRLIPMDDEGIVGDWVTLPQDSFQSGWREAFDGKRALTTEQMDRSLAQAFQESANSLTLQDGTWSIDPLNDSLYIFYPFEGRILVEVDAVIANAVFVYDDVAELYWDYISEDPNAETDDVSVVVQLPVPEGVQIIPGENVLAWGHGPEGVVNITAAGTIEYTVAKVLPGQYAQAHILFPESWLTNLPREMEAAFSGTRRDAAIALEKAWTDTWSNSRVNGLTVEIVILALSALSIIAAVVLYLVFGREEKSIREARAARYERNERGVSQDDGACESPSTLPSLSADGSMSVLDVDAAVIGRLMRGNRISMDDLVAALMQLSHKGAMSIDLSDAGSDDRSATDDASKGIGLDARYGDLVIRMKPSGKSKLVSDVEKEAVRILFGVFADGYQMTTTKEIFEFAKKDPKAFEDAMDSWQDALSAEVDRLDLFDGRSAKVRKGMILACITIAVISLIVGFMGWPMPALALLVAAGCVGVLGNYTIRKKALGAELSDQVERISWSIAEMGSLPGGSIERYVAYLFAIDDRNVRFDRIDDPTDLETLWLAPVVGRGGKLMEPRARHLADALDKASLEAGR